MIEKSGNALRVSGPMLIAGATDLLKSGRSFLSSANGAGDLVFDLSAVEQLLQTFHVVDTRELIREEGHGS